MDLNIATTSFVNSKQENNQMFKTIKNKFDANAATEAVAVSPPKFSIPLLKIPCGDTLENIQTIQSNKSPTQLNKFLIQKLQEKHSNNDLCAGNTDFVLPKLISPAQNKVTVKHQLSAFPSKAEKSNICSLTTAINELKVQENSNKNGVTSQISLPATIDLTTALATKFETHQATPPARDFMKPAQTNDEVDFEIPFIDCDRQYTPKQQELFMPASNEYCVKDVSQLVLQHSLAEPSAVGRFLSADSKKYLAPLPLKYFTSQFLQIQVKHSIEPFRFDTQSPDDVVLLALSKYQRRHNN